MVLRITGRKRFIKLFEMDSIESQRIHFDKYLDKRLIFWVFRIAFSPMLYKNRALDQRALIHQKGNDMATLFYGRFRDFCSATLARFNYYLQFYFLGEVLFDEALPDYLQDQGIENIHKRKMNIMFEAKSIQEEISTSEELNFGNYALSNISDWITVDEMNDLLYSISQKTTVETNLLMRYIHKNPINEKMQYSGLDFDESAGISIRDVDRFPFYTLLKTKRKMQK
jgi:S-adenosylmethionine:diacylglycerol 3-amino-3-carboxypropyl transferase